MAHLAKYKLDAVRPILDHCNRAHAGTLERENIDSSRTHLNYNIYIGIGENGLPLSFIDRTRQRDFPSVGTVLERMNQVRVTTNKKVRKDSVVLADLVVTAPKDLKPEDEEPFFIYCSLWAAHEIGVDNMLPATVHMDEATPHIHISFTPINNGKFSFKTLCDRKFYQKLHKDLNEYVDKKLGYHVSIVLPEEEQAIKQLSKVDQEHYKVLRASVEDLEQKKTELVKTEASLKELEPKVIDAKTTLAALETKDKELNKAIKDNEADLKEKKREHDKTVKGYQKEEAQAKKQLDKAKAELKEETDRLELVRLAGDGASKRVAALQSIAKLLGAWKKSRGSKRTEVFNRILAGIRQFFDNFRPAVQPDNEKAHERDEEQLEKKPQRDLSALMKEKQALEPEISRMSAAEVMRSAREHNQSQHQAPQKVQNKGYLHH